MIRNFKKKLTLASVCIGASINTYAAYNTLDGTFNGLPRAETENKKFNGYIGGLSNQANTEIGHVPGNRYWFDGFFDFHSKDENRAELKLTVSALRNDQALLMQSVQEAYIGVNAGKNQMKLGRVIVPWSTMDSTWGFGKLNNRKNFDGFDPGQEGLVGLSFERQSANGMRYRFFGSPLYVPELNPSMDINKGSKTITTRHPWVDVPASTAEVEGTTKRIEYTVNMPDIMDVVQRYTVGANVGWENKNWVVDTFYVYKPENTQTPKVEVAYNTGTDVIKANITPEFFYHHVFGGNLKYRNKDVEMYISGMGVHPNTFPDGNVKDTQATNIKTEKRREAYMGGGIGRSNDLYSLGLNYVARLSPFDRENDSLAVDPRWNQAVNAVLTRNFGRLYSLGADIKYDMLTTDRLVMLKASYRPTKELMMSVGVNMIGTPTDGQSYWSPYTNNDAVYGSLRYIF